MNDKTKFLFPELLPEGLWSSTRSMYRISLQEEIPG